jgi:hypothetical protein
LISVISHAGVGIEKNAAIKEEVNIYNISGR